METASPSASLAKPADSLNIAALWCPGYIYMMTNSQKVNGSLSIICV